MKPHFLFLLYLIFLLVANDIKAQEEPCVITINYKNNSNFNEKLILQDVDFFPKDIDSVQLHEAQGRVTFVYKGSDIWANIRIKSNKICNVYFITSAGELIFNIDCSEKEFEIKRTNQKSIDFENTNDELRAFLLQYYRNKNSIDSALSLNDSISVIVLMKQNEKYLEDAYKSFIQKAKTSSFRQNAELIAVHLSDHNVRQNLNFSGDCLELYDFLIEKFPNTNDFFKQKEIFERKLKPILIGKNFKIPDNLLLKNIDGEQKSLNETIEKSSSPVIITEFWASWCGPCRQNHPEIIKLSNQYPSLEIIFISIDENGENWVKAIQKDNLTKYKHLSDDSGWQARVLRENNISQIPFNAVFDSKRQIIGINIYGTDLENLIKKSLENK